MEIHQPFSLDTDTIVTDVTATLPITSSGGTTPNISTSMATNKLIGRGTAGTGVMEEITLGTGLSLSGTTLNASVTSPGGSDTQVQFNNSGSFGGDAGFTYNKTTDVLSVVGGVITPKIYPASDSTNAVGIYKANGTTQILYTDTTNGRIGIGSAPTDYNFEVYSPVSGNIAMKIWTGGSIFGYTLGRNTSNGFLDITGNQGIFSGIHVDQIKSDGAITIAGNAVLSNWATSMGVGSGSGSPISTVDIRSNSNTIPNLSMGGGVTSNYNFRRNTSTGYLEIAGVQGLYTGYLFSTGNYSNVFTMIDGVGAVFNETGESVLDFRIESDTDANNFFVDASANANGFGTNAPSAKVHIIKTTEQLRVGYDASNYYSTTVGSTGGVTFDAVGSGAGFTFSDQITGSSGYVGSDLTASLPVKTNGSKKLVSGAIDIASSEVTGTLPIANGGTGVTSFGTGQVIFFNGTTQATDGNFTFGSDILTAVYVKASTNFKSSDGSDGWTGTFTTGDARTATVKGGIITDVA